MIVKVQMPLSFVPPAERGRGLVYAAGRKNMAEQPLPPTVTRVVMERPSRKAYFEASWNEPASMWTIGDQVGDQAW